MWVAHNESHTRDATHKLRRVKYTRSTFDSDAIHTPGVHKQHAHACTLLSPNDYGS